MSYAAFEAAIPPARYAGNPVLPNGPSYPSWRNGNVCDYSVLPNPLNPAQLLMFFSGFNATNIASGGVGRATAPSSDPSSWTDASASGPVLGVGPAGAWDHAYVRLNNVWSEGSRLFMSYTGSANQAGQDESTGIAFSDDAGVHWTRYVGNPVFSQIAGEETVSQGFIYKEGSTYYQYFSYRAPAPGYPSGGWTPIKGIKLATASSPYGPWTRQSGEILSNWYYEWHQVVKLNDGTYVLTYERPDSAIPPANARWTLKTAYASSPLGPFQDSAVNPILSGSGVAGTFDYGHAATGAWYVVNGVWYLFYAGGDNLANYGYSTWQCGLATSSYLEPVATLTGDATVGAVLGASQVAAYQAASRLTVSAGPVAAGKVTLSGHRVPGSVVYVSR